MRQSRALAERKMFQWEVQTKPIMINNRIYPESGCMMIIIVLFADFPQCKDTYAVHSQKQMTSNVTAMLIIHISYVPTDVDNIKHSPFTLRDNCSFQK